MWAGPFKQAYNKVQNPPLQMSVVMIKMKKVIKYAFIWLFSEKSLRKCQPCDL